MQKIKNLSEHLALFFNPITGQHCLKTIKAFKKGDIIEAFTAKEYLTEPSYLSVQISEHQHIHLHPEFLQYTNHSCEPNIFFDTEQGNIIALTDITIHEEICFFYPATEWKMAQAFHCACNTKSCLGIIQGANFLKPETIKKYRFNKHIADKLAHS